VGCVPHVVVESWDVQIGEGQGRVKFFKEEYREGVWSSYGDSKMCLSEVKVFC